LVTTERAGVSRQFVRELTSKNEFIEIPIGEGDAPNLFVSAIVVRGSKESTNQKFRDTDYKLGYCELTVDKPANVLDVVLEVPSGDVLPAQQVDAAVVVKDSKGQPVAGAEVTFYAVDEGVLSLTGYETPDPGHRFHESLPALREDLAFALQRLDRRSQQRPFGNKGLLIGGGGDGLTSLRDKARKNFRATAVWNGGLITDGQGRATISFPAPENLTGFKVFAVALGDTEHYGAGTAKIHVNKPVIIEPALPAFANLGDDLTLQAVVQNTTSQPGRFEVTLLADATVELPTGENKVQQIALGAAPGPREWRSTVDLGAGQSTGLPIQVKFTQTGDAMWTWTIREVDAKGDPRTDSVQSQFQVGHPVPMLSETMSVRIDPGESTDLPASLGGKELLKGYGRIDATISNSRMIDAMDALKYNLDYPYGCVEQTTSSTLPWMTMNSLEKVFPDLGIEPAKKEGAIRHGLNRLLSMQTSSGGLAYWPGGDEPEFWAKRLRRHGLGFGCQGRSRSARASLGVVVEMAFRAGPRGGCQRGREHLAPALPGALHPGAGRQSRAGLPRDLLQDAGQTRAPVSCRARPGHLGKRQRRPVHPRHSAVGTQSGCQCPGPCRGMDGPALPVAAKLMAWTRLDAKAKQTDELLAQMLRLRKPHHGWGSTYANAWPLLALARVADLEAPALATTDGKLQFGETSADVQLAAKLSSQAASFAFDGDVSKQELRWTSSCNSRCMPMSK